MGDFLEGLGVIGSMVVVRGLVDSLAWCFGNVVFFSCIAVKTWKVKCSVKRRKQEHSELHYPPQTSHTLQCCLGSLLRVYCWQKSRLVGSSLVVTACVWYLLALSAPSYIRQQLLTQSSILAFCYHCSHSRCFCIYLTDDNYSDKVHKQI